MNGKVPDLTPAADQLDAVVEAGDHDGGAERPGDECRRRFQTASREPWSAPSWRSATSSTATLRVRSMSSLMNLLKGVAGQVGGRFAMSARYIPSIPAWPAPSSSGRHRRWPDRGDFPGSQTVRGCWNCGMARPDPNAGLDVKPVLCCRDLGSVRQTLRAKRA